MARPLRPGHLRGLALLAAKRTQLPKSGSGPRTLGLLGLTRPNVGLVLGLGSGFMVAEGVDVVSGTRGDETGLRDGWDE
ncbi:hypothetical protein GCM10023334_122600 [Nonomuraea thailandensis]